MFTTNSQGTGDAEILNAITFAQVTSSQPVAAGSWIQIYCTGLGAPVQPVTTGNVPPSPPPQTMVQPDVRIDGQPVTVSWAGFAPGFVGLYAVNAQVPASMATGAHQLQIVMPGISSNTVTVAVVKN